VARSLTARLIRALSGVVAIGIGSIAIAGCGTQPGDALARQACTYVSSSISLYESGLATKDPKKKAALLDEASNRLQMALQPASLATTDNSSWQALMTTISESSRVPESVLVSSLEAQCFAADHPGSPPPVDTTPDSTPGT
jgi:hypothetical protein